MKGTLRASASFASILFIALIAAIDSSPANSQEQKLKIEDLVTRHLDSIGTADARSKAASRIASGPVKFITRVGGVANVDGQAMMVSLGAKLRFGMKFPTQEYTGEDLAFDGNRTATGFLTQGRRSQLSLFLNSQNIPLKEGLIGGTLSTAWPFFRLDQTQPKLDYRGLKKVDGQQLHEVSYRPQKGSPDLKVLLYFDPESFRHVMSKYSYAISASIGTREASDINRESYFSITETFDDFRAVDGITLPHKYTLQLSAEGGRGSSIQEWMLSVSKVAHNQKIDDQIFSLK